MHENPVLERGRRTSVDQTAIRAALAFGLVGFTWIVVTDLVLLGIFHDRWGEVWPRSMNRAVFVLIATAALLLLVRHYGRQLEASDATSRLSEEALRRSELRYRSLVERVPGVVWLNEVDRDDPTRTHCVYVGPQLEDMLGCTPEEWMADDDLWQRVIHPDDLPAVLEENHLADAKGTLGMEYRAFRRDGGVVWIHDEAVLIPADGDRPACWQGVMVDITAQRVQDVALHEFTESLGGVFKASPLGLIVLEPDGRVRHWNPAAERMFGWTAGEVVGQPLPYVPSHKKEEFEQLMRQELAGGSIAGFETTRMRKDGSLVDVSLSVAPLRDADGRIAGMLGVIEDISERLAASESLATRTRQQGAVAALGLVSLKGGDPQALLERATAVVAETLDLEISGIFELPREEDVLRLRAGTGWRDGLVGSLGIDPKRQTLAALALDSGEPVLVRDLTTDERLPPPTILLEHGVVSGVALVVYGATRPLGVLEALSKKPRQFTADDVRFLQGVAAIVGLAIERDRANAALATAEAKYRGLVERGPGVVYLTEPRTSPSEVTYVSPQVVEMLGYPAAAWTEDPTFWTTVLHPDDRDEVLRSGARSVDTGEPHDTEYRFVAADGREVWVHDKGTLVLGPDGAPLVRQGVFVDVTERRRAEEERKRTLERQLRLQETLAERAEQLERLAQERQQMLHRIVRAQEEERERVALELHDGLGQVLTSISLFASDLEDEVPPEAKPRAVRVTELVRRAIGDSRQLVWSLRPPELERLGLVPAIRRLAEEVSVPEMPVDLHEEIGDLRLPPESEAVVYRVVQEAVHNAQKHSRAGAISILMRRRDGMLATLVEDNGRGFEPESVPSGRGLGLVGMRERAELVDGDLVVESGAGTGTRIRLEVPIGGQSG